MSPPTLLLVHGAWHGSWCWDRLTGEFRSDGLHVDAIDLPGLGRGDAPSSADRHDLAAHVDWLHRRVANIPGPVVVCAHSYGGAVAGEALAGLRNVRAAIFVAAFLLEVGESCRDANPASGERVAGPRRDGDYLVVPPDVGATMFYLDAAPHERLAAAARLCPEHVGTVGTPVRAAGWHDVPTTYVMTRRDRAIPLAAQQRMAVRADAQVTLDSDHSPMLTQPAALATAIRGAAGLSNR